MGLLLGFSKVVGKLQLYGKLLAPLLGNKVNGIVSGIEQVTASVTGIKEGTGTFYWD